MKFQQILDSKFLLRIIAFAVLFILTDLTLTTAGSYFLMQVVLDFILGAAMGVVFGVIFTRLYFKRLVRIAIAWFALFILQWLNNMIEGYLYTTMLTEALLLAAAILGILISCVHALFLGFLFPPSTTDSSLWMEIKNYFDQRPWYHWLWRLILASLLFLVIYYGIGHLISPIVIPFYTDMAMGLKIPPIGVVLLVEPIRGFLYILTLLPLLVSLKGETKELYLLLAFVLYLPSVAMLLPSPTYPVLLRIVHGLEILVDSLLFTATLILLLRPKPTEPS